MMTPHSQLPERQTPRPPEEEPWVDLPPDDGTLSMPPPATRLEVAPAPRADRVWWGVVASLAAAAGLAVALWIAAPASGGRAPSALAVITTQHQALTSDDPALRERALDLGADYLEHGPEGPYQDLIRGLHRDLGGAPSTGP